MSDVKVRGMEVVIKELRLSIGRRRYWIVDAETGTVIYTAKYRVSCQDKAERMEWKVVRQKQL